MAVSLDIRTTGVRKLARALARFDKAVSQKATQQALNRTINNMRATAIIEGARWMGIRRRLVEKRFQFNIQSKHGAVGIIGAKARIRMEARGVAIGRPFNLIRWGATRAGDGVRANAWGSERTYRGLSIAASPSRFVFVVNKKAKRKGRIGRGAYGPGLTSAIADKFVAEQIERVGEDKFEQHFIAAAKFRLSRAGWRAVIR